MTIEKTITRSVRFITKQEKSFKVNLLRRGIQNFATMLTQQYQSIYITELGATPLQLGVVNGFGGVAEAASALPTGWSVDRYGIRRTFLFGTSLMILGALLFALATNWIVAIPAMTIATLALRIVMIACPAVCGSCLNNEERATGMQLCDSLSSAFGLIAPIIGAIIISEFGGMNEGGIRPLYYLQTVIIFLSLTLVLREFKNPGRTATSTTTSDILNGVQEVLKQGVAVKRGIAINCLLMVSAFLSPVYTPLFAAEIKNADQLVLGSMAAASWIVPLLLSIPVGRLADKIGRKKTMYITIPVYCLSLSTLIFAQDSTMLLVSGVLQGFLMLALITGLAMRSELVPIPLLGRWLGLLGLFRGVIGIIAPIFAGFIWSTIEPSTVLFFMILTQLLIIPILSTMPETLKMGIKNE